MSDDDGSTTVTTEKDWWADCDGDDEVRERWLDAPSDPDLAEDLGYELLDIDVVETSNPTKKLMILPRDEDLIKDDAFIVTEPNGYCDLLENV